MLKLLASILIFHSVSKRVLVLVISLVVIFDIILAPPFSVPEHEPVRELIGTITKESWVPLFILRDPPSSGSNATIAFSYQGERNLIYDSRTSNLTVRGETTVDFLVGCRFHTSENDRIDYGIIAKLNQTWTIWQCYNYGNEWIEAVLNSSQVIETEKQVPVDNLQEYGIWTTQPSSPIASLRTAFHEEHQFFTFRYTGSRSNYLYAGYYVILLDYEFRVYVSLQLRNVAMFTYLRIHNETGVHEFTIFSNGEITSGSNRKHICTGVIIWFES